MSTDDFVSGWMAARDYYGGTDQVTDHHGAECHKRVNTRYACTCHRNAQVAIAHLHANIRRRVTLKGL